MRSFLPAAALMAAILWPSSASWGYSLRQLFFGPAYGVGCGAPCDPGCAVYEPGCACDPCCAFEPTCACVGPCVDGRRFAGQTWSCCHEATCACVEPACAYVEPTCGCYEPTCGCYEPTCGCYEPTCGCGPGFGPRRRGILGWLSSAVGRVCAPLGIGGGCGCGGCASELYWNEWHNDPPRCHDPCDCHGNWVGPGYEGYHAPSPYGPPHPPAGVYEPEVEVEARGRVTSPPVSRTSAPGVRPQVGRKPYPPAHRTYQR